MGKHGRPNKAEQLHIEQTLRSYFERMLSVSFASKDSGINPNTVKKYYKVFSDEIKLYEILTLLKSQSRPSENQMDQAERINELFRASKCDIGVGDLGYGGMKVKTIQDGGANRISGKIFPGVGSENFYGCRSISNESKPMQIHQDSVDEHGQETSRISIDKTSQIQKFIDLIETSRPHPKGDHPRSKLLIPFSADREYETDWLISEFCSVTRKDIKKTWIQD